MKDRRLKFWGWGYEDQTLSQQEACSIAKRTSNHTGIPLENYISPPKLEEIELPSPKIKALPSLSEICSQTKYDRAAHSYGKSYPDYIRAYNRNYSNAPDVIAFPRQESDIIKLLEWADDANIAVIPFGCGSSVVGGIEPLVGHNFKATMSMDMRQMSKVLEIDPISRAARIEAGVLGPSLEQQLKPSGFTFRHFPQSFEFSTLGGWIATRSGGHFATLHTHIDELVESIRSISPSGQLESRRLPGSGAGPSPDRLLMGSEGSLGIITQSWVRLQRKPRFRSSVTGRFNDLESAANAIRAVAQAGLWPSNCRLVDAEETKLAGAGDGSFHLILLGFESSYQPVDHWMDKAIKCAEEFGGDFSAPLERNKTADAWRDAFITAPFKREGLISCGIMHDTFETAITWDRLPRFHKNVKAATEEAIIHTTGHRGHVSCRFTHAYPDGTAPYFTFHAKAIPGHELEHWKAIKEAVSDSLIKEGGTITHHHAIGRDHMPWYLAQRPEIFGEALKSIKTRLDPSGILNPGVIVPIKEKV